MSRRSEVLIAVAILIIAVIVVLLLLRKPADDQPDTNTATTTDGAATTVTPSVVPAGPASAQTVSRIFVERFGSYSTESDYANVSDVLGLATPALQARLQALAEEARQNAGGAYYGVSTKVITTKTESENAEVTVIAMTTQRKESFDSPGNTSVRYQDITLTLKHVGEDWLVDAFTWAD